MTNQEAFDRMVTHLRRQGKRSTDGWACRYRSEAGLRCAVGVLVTDEFYTPQMEGMSTFQSELRELLSKALPGVSVALLNIMQYTHDVASPGDWEQAWQGIAKQFGLTMPDSTLPTQQEVPCALSSASE